MKTIKTVRLTRYQKEEINALIHECRSEIPALKLSFPYEDGTLFYLLYNASLVSVLALNMPSRPFEPAECTAFTRPSHWRTGCFSTLFSLAETEFEEIDLLFPTDHSNEGAEKALESLGTELAFSEYRMTLSLTSPLCQKNAISVSPKHLSYTVSLKEAKTGCFHFFDATLNTSLDIPCGTCSFTCFETSACLSDFEIVEPLRGQGIGKKALSLIISYAKNLGLSSLSLHVSGDNIPAVSLYKKTGFQISETLSYYLY